MTRLRIGLTVASLVLLGAALPARATGFGFAPAITLPGSEGGDEPSLAISATGVRYASWQSPGEFARSVDGLGWTNTGRPDDSAVGDVTNAVDASGAVYNAQICGGLTALHTCLWRSIDGGATWTQRSEIADMHPGASDRPWIDVWPHRTTGSWDPEHTIVYLEYHTFSPDDLVFVTTSTDGGRTFSAPVAIESDTNAVDASGCNTIPGGIVVDEKSGDVYAGWLSGEDVGQNLATGCNYSEIGPYTKAWVSVSKDHGARWTSRLAWHGAYDATTNTGDNAAHLFSALGVDGAEQVHVMLGVRRNDDPASFVAACQASRVTQAGCAETGHRTDLVLTTSPDGGEHWTPELAVNATPGSYFMPWIAAGGIGAIDAVFYRSPSLRPNDPSATWYADAAQITGATARVSGDAAAYVAPPTITEVQLDAGPVHSGGICSFGIFCSVVPKANRNLADSIALALDPAGGANAAWTNDHGTKRVVRSACQDAGRSAFAAAPDLAGCYRRPAIATAVRMTRPATQVLGKRVTRSLATTGVEDDPFAVALVGLALGLGVAIRRRRIA